MSRGEPFRRILVIATSIVDATNVSCFRAPLGRKVLPIHEIDPLAHPSLFRRHRAGAEGVTISRAAKWWLLALSAVMAGFAAFAPVLIIHPFKAQTENGVAISHLLKRWSPLLTIVLLAAMFVLLFKLWRGARWWSRALAIVAIAVSALAAWFARQNHFEWMFNPLSQPAYARADAATFVADADLVMAVARNGEAAAYPIRQLAYHHLVQDTVGGVPIVVTY